MTGISTEALTALLQVVMIDLVLAGDNAIVIGLAAAGLPPQQRTKAILVGIAAATLLRIVFASITTWLLAVVGLLLAGGILLLWVCWTMWRELRATAAERQAAAEALARGGHGEAAAPGPCAPRKSFAQAAWQIVVADVSMSLDNVLAVAGAADDDGLLPGARGEAAGDGDGGLGGQVGHIGVLAGGGDLAEDEERPVGLSSTATCGSRT